MGASGTITIDFGSAPGGFEANVAVTGQGSIVAGSLVEAWVMPTATSNHTADEHLVDPPRVIAGTVVAGTGFTVYGYSRESHAMEPAFSRVAPQENQPRTYGQWTVAWVWV